jgi:hypothetical protein
MMILICRHAANNMRLKGTIRRKMILIEVTAKCRHLKILTCNGTLRQVFIRVYRLEMANFLRIFSHVGIFNPAV